MSQGDLRALSSPCTLCSLQHLCFSSVPWTQVSAPSQCSIHGKHVLSCLQRMSDGPMPAIQSHHSFRKNLHIISTKTCQWNMSITLPSIASLPPPQHCNSPSFKAPNQHTRLREHTIFTLRIGLVFHLSFPCRQPCMWRLATYYASNNKAQLHSPETHCWL